MSNDKSGSGNGNQGNGTQQKPAQASLPMQGQQQAASSGEQKIIRINFEKPLAFGATPEGKWEPKRADDVALFDPKGRGVLMPVRAGGNGVLVPDQLDLIPWSRIERVRVSK